MEFILVTGIFGGIVGILLSIAIECVCTLLGTSIGQDRILALIGLCAALGPVVSFGAIVAEEYQSSRKSK